MGWAIIKKFRGNPMLRMCGAKARSNGKLPCRQPSMANGRCRLHGGLTPKHNPGPKTAEGRLKQKMASWKHGLRSKEAIEEQKAIRLMMRYGKDFLNTLETFSFQ